MLTIPDQNTNIKSLSQQIEEEEENNASIMYQEGWESEELPSKIASEADRNRIITTF